MIDVDEIKARIDCRDIIEGDLGKPKHHSAKYNAYPCPLHHEQKGYSFVVYEDGWKCYGKCQTSGDVFKWLELYRDMDFKAALSYLAGGNVAMSAPRPPRPIEPETSEPPPMEWQEKARRVAHQAQEFLWSSKGMNGLKYLREQRGLCDGTILSAGLGWIPGDRQWFTIEGLTVPAGITIPWECGGALWAINVRRSAGQPKYQQVKGGHTKGALYNVDRVEPGLPALFVEGEFDCMLAQHYGLGLVNILTLGGASNRLMNRWLPLLIHSPKIFAVMDNDEAGEKAAERLGALSNRVKRVTTPFGKDVTDFHLECAGETAVFQWLYEVVR